MPALDLRDRSMNLNLSTSESMMYAHPPESSLLVKNQLKAFVYCPKEPLPFSSFLSICCYTLAS